MDSFPLQHLPIEIVTEMFDEACRDYRDAVLASVEAVPCPYENRHCRNKPLATPASLGQVWEGQTNVYEVFCPIEKMAAANGSRTIDYDNGRICGGLQRIRRRIYLGTDYKAHRTMQSSHPKPQKNINDR
ncbi:hypothetical protein BDQ17DRAFT_1412901 [Cyathus striatus]|nr:hypothetical protein BDQ17DRAFT_1412901 [Cyathus striatus]